MLKIISIMTILSESCQWRFSASYCSADTDLHLYLSTSALQLAEPTMVLGQVEIPRAKT